MNKCVVCKKELKQKNGVYWQRFCSVAHRSKWHYWERSGQLTKMLRKGKKV